LDRNKPITIAVTAASGRLAQAVLRALKTNNAAANLIAVARDPVRVNSDEVEVREGDYESTEQMTAAFRGVDTVIMISAPVAGGGDRLQLHKNVIAAAVNAQVREIIYTSIIGNGCESGTLFADFADVNHATEEAVQASGLKWVIARNGLYLDLDLLQIRAASMSGGIYTNSAGAGRCGYISIAELGNALACLAKSDHCNGQVLNLIGATYSQADLVAAVNRVFGLQVQYLPITHEQNIDRLRAIEFIAARGEAVINMLAGCFQCIANNVFDVGSDYRTAAGREPLSLEQQMRSLKLQSELRAE
jgi:NAD(P)H dehydrogenase (quinone)